MAGKASGTPFSARCATATPSCSCCAPSRTTRWPATPIRRRRSTRSSSSSCSPTSRRSKAGSPGNGARPRATRRWRARSQPWSGPWPRSATACRSTGRISRPTSGSTSLPAFLLTDKPVLVVVNIGEDQLDRADELASARVERRRRARGVPAARSRGCRARPRGRAPRCSRGSGSASVWLPRVARAAYHLLGRRTFLTTGDKETRAWTFRAGAKAPECAGVIHSDLQRGFIRAEVIEWGELLEIGSWAKAKELGRLRVEGKDYVVAGRRRARDPVQRVTPERRDGDVARA